LSELKKKIAQLEQENTDLKESVATTSEQKVLSEIIQIVSINDLDC
jgi:cell shape-determining protein MreC